MQIPTNLVSFPLVPTENGHSQHHHNGHNDNYYNGPRYHNTFNQDSSIHEVNHRNYDNYDNKYHNYDKRMHR